MSEGRSHSSSNLQLLDVSFRLEADWPEALGLLNQLYIAPEFHQPSAPEAVRASFHLDTNNEETGCTVMVDGSGEALPVSGEPGAALSEWVFQRFLQKSRGFTLVHAAALARHDRGALIVGGPHAGKTTLAMALAAQGLEYYSDDVAPLSRIDGTLHPFRRAAGVRLAGGGRRYRLPARPAAGRRGADPPPPCPLGWVFFLATRSNAALPTPGGGRLEEMPGDQAALGLLEHTMNREPYGRLGACDEEHPHLKALADLLAALATARCYRLSAGRPEETTRTLVDLMDGGRSSASGVRDGDPAAGSRS